VPGFRRVPLGADAVGVGDGISVVVVVVVLVVDSGSAVGLVAGATVSVFCSQAANSATIAKTQK